MLKGVDAVKRITNPTITASVKLGVSMSQSKNQQTAHTARPVLLQSEADLDLAADDTVHLQGTEVRAGGHLRVVGGRDVVIESAQSSLGNPPIFSGALR